MFKPIVLRHSVLLFLLLGSASGYVWCAEEGNGAKPEVELGWREKIVLALAKPVTLDAKDTPLADVVDHLGKQAGIANMVVDTRALDNVGIGTDTPITRDLKGVSLRNVLRLALRDFDLTYVVRDGALVITTPDQAGAQWDTKVFNVWDLVRPDDQAGPEQCDYDTLIASADATSAEDEKNGLRLVVYFVPTKSLMPEIDNNTFEGEELLEVIRELVEPDSWNKEDVYARAAPRRLIIRQSREVHRKICQMLNRLGVSYQNTTNVRGGGFGSSRMRGFGGGMGRGTGEGMGGAGGGADESMGSGGFF